MNNQSITEKLSPELISQALSMFQRIEQEANMLIGNQFDDEDFALELADQLGDTLKGPGGFRRLQYAHDLAQTESERTVLSLEEAAFRMDDKSLRAITDLCRYVREIEREWNKLRSNYSQEGSRRLSCSIELAVEDVKFIEKETRGHWECRAMDYRKEIEKLKA